MNNILLRYFEIIGFVLWWIAWLSINRITEIFTINVRWAILVLIICLWLFIYWAITKNKLLNFDYNVSHWKWRKELIYNKTVRICENNPHYQIWIWDDDRPFSEPWTNVYPDNQWNSKCSIELVNNWIIFKTIPRVFCDWQRIWVPLPQQEVIKNKDNIDNDERIYFRNKNSLEYKLGKLIGEFYIHKNMEGISQMSWIEIR